MERVKGSEEDLFRLSVEDLASFFDAEKIRNGESIERVMELKGKQGILDLLQSNDNVIVGTFILRSEFSLNQRNYWKQELRSI